MKTKLIKLSFITLLSFNYSTFASDTLSDALTDGNFKGKLQAYFIDRDRGAKVNGRTRTTSDASILNLGLDLNYITGSFYGFKAGVTVQTSNAPFASENAKKTMSWDVYGSGAVLSEAYLDYNYKKTNIRIGRQYVKMPLLVSSGSRMIKQAYEGATFVSKDLIPNTTLSGAYVKKFQNRTDNDGNIADFEDLPLNGDYAYTASITNRSIPNLDLTYAYGKADNSHDLNYFEAKYKNNINDIGYKLSGQYNITDYVNEAKQDADYYGMKVDLKIGNFESYLAYAEVDDGTAKWSIVGGGKPQIYTTTIINSGEYKESEQYAINASYKFEANRFLLGARYVNVDYADDTEADFTTFYVKHKFSKALKGLSASIYYEQKEADTTANEFDELWVYLNYSF